MNMLRYIIVIFVLNLSATLFAQEIEDNQLLWVARPTATDSLGSESASMTIDSEGNIYVCGWFEGIKDFGGGHILSSTKYDGFIAKYSPQGSIMWARQTYTPGTFHPDRNWLVAEMRSMDSDKDGNLYILGVSDTVNFGNGITLNQRPSVSTSLFFIAKYNKDGEILWAKRITPSNAGNFVLNVDKNGNIFFSGFDVNNNERYNKDGNRIIDTTVSFGKMGGNYLTTDNDNNIIIAGRIGADDYHLNYEHDGLTLKVKGVVDSYVMKYNSQGKAIWAVTIGGDSAFCQAKSVAVDSSGNIYITGEFNHPIDFGNGINLESDFIPISQKRDFFLAKYNSNGQVAWAKKIENSDKYGFSGTVNNVEVDSRGYIYISAYVNDTLDFGNNKIIISTNGNALLVVYDKNGFIVQVRKTDNNYYPHKSMKIATNGDIYTGGAFYTTVNFGAKNILKTNNYSAFVAKYAAFNPVGVEESEFLKTNNILSIHPNPAQSISRISFKTTAPSHTRLTLTDVLRRQTLLKEQTLDAGEHSADINMADFPAGIYVLTLEAGEQVFSQKVVIER